MVNKVLAALIGCVLLTSIPALAEEGHIRLKSNLREAEELYSRAQYHASLSLLDAHAEDSAPLFLIGRDYYMLSEFKKATENLKKAVIAAPKNSEYTDWLGRAYGKRAEISNPLSAAVLAKKAKEKFERAVQLNPKNAEALSDLFDYYLQAPVLLGGGYQKAEAVAEKMSAVDPCQAFFEQSELAQKQHGFETAEQPPRKSVSTWLMDRRTLVQGAESKEILSMPAQVEAFTRCIAFLEQH